MAAKIKNIFNFIIESMVKARQQQVDRMIKSRNWGMFI